MRRLFIVAVTVWSLFPSNESMLRAQSGMWVTAYYAGWSQGTFDNGVLPAQDIDYSVVTHIIHFSLVPRADGSLDSASNSILPSNSRELLSRAHAAGKKVLICVGGAGTNGSFRGATGLLTLPLFIENLVNFMTERGYDGIDIDWETLELTDLVQFTLLVTQLRSRLDQITPRPLLTAAVAGQPTILSTLQNAFDQIYLITYDFSSAWPGWVTWHNSPVYNGGLRFPSTGALVPSSADLLGSMLSGGIAANKLSNCGDCHHQRPGT